MGFTSIFGGVSFADARASMKENSRAAIHSDAKTNEGDITLMAARPM